MKFYMTDMTEKIKVGVLGCTGAVGQKLVSLLADHPMFDLVELVASEKSAGMRYGDRVHWKEAMPVPRKVADTVIRTADEELSSRILFSGMDASVAGEVESMCAERGHIVVSNSRNHRMDEDVPLVIPEINADHLALVRRQKTFGKGGFIVTNPNCSTIVMAMALYPVYRKYGIGKVVVTTMQAISGAGYPGLPSMDILGNVIPYISGEEAKMETEIKKIFGVSDGKSVSCSDMVVSAMCNRVAVREGHTMSISFDTVRKGLAEEDILSCYGDIPSLGLPSSPESPVVYSGMQDRPQPLLDGMTGNGMTVTVGGLRRCPVLGWKINAFGHNTLRGAAGAAVLNAELIVKEGLVAK